MDARIKALEAVYHPEPNNGNGGNGSGKSPFDQYRGKSFQEFWAMVGQDKLAYFPYEELLYNELQKHKYLWVKKATGLGVTEFMLRYMAWLCVFDNSLRNRHVCIVTGPRIDIAEDLIERIKRLFPFEVEGKKTVAVINGITIEAFPSNHLDAMRGIPNVAFILLDEADFFRIGEQQNARDVSERYIAKSDPTIVMVSTPNIPGGLYERIEKEEPCLYHKVFLPYTVGLGNRYTQEDMDKARKSPSFEREYNLKYGYGIGNVFKAEDIDACVAEYDLNEYKHARCKLFVDPAFGLLEQNSKFAWIVLAMTDGKVRVYAAEQYAGMSYNESMDKLGEMISTFNPDKIAVDSANPVFIKGAKEKIGENPNYDLEEEKDDEQWWRVKPVSFGAKEGQKMLQAIQSLVSGHYLEVHPQFEDLILQMRMAVTKDDGKLDKTQHSMDLFDCLRMGAATYRVENQ